MALTKTEVSELYVILFNRASEKSGNQNWVNSGYNTVATMADAMLDTDAANEYYDSLKIVSNEDFVEYIYDKALNKGGATVDPDGKAGWVKFLETGASRGEMIEKMIEAIKEYQVGGAKYATADQATKDAAKQFANKVIVSDYTAENLENIDVSEIGSTVSFDVLNVTYDTTTIDAAKDKVDALKKPADGETGMLTESLATLKAANTDKADWLKSLDKINTNLSDATADPVELTDGSTGTIATYYTNTSAAMEDSTTGVNIKDFADRSDAIQDTAISEKVATLKGTVNTNELIAGKSMTGLISKVKEADKNVDTKVKAKAAATLEVSAQIAAFKAVNPNNGTALEIGTADNNLNFIGTQFGKLTSKAFETPATDVYANLVDGKWVLTDAGKAANNSGPIKNIDKVYAAVKAEEAAEKAVETAKAGVKNAVKDVILAEHNAHSVVDFGSSIDSGTGKSKLDGISDVSYYKNSAALTGGKNAVFTVVSSGIAEGDVIKYDGIDYTVGASLAITPSAGTGKWVVTTTASLITFKAKEAGAIKTVPTADKITVTGTGTVAEDAKVTVTEAGGTVTTAGTLTKAENLKEALDALKAFETLKAQFEESRDLFDTLEAKDKAIEDAQKAITNATDLKEDAGLGLNLIIIDTAAKSATSEDDVFTLNLDEDTISTTISDFGASGLDQLFVGSGYNFVKLGSKEKIEDNLGDASKLEIFYKQDGSDVKLYIENETFAGNSKGTEDMVTVTLTGISTDDISFNGGLIQAGEIA